MLKSFSHYQRESSVAMEAEVLSNLPKNMVQPFVQIKLDQNWSNSLRDIEVKNVNGHHGRRINYRLYNSPCDPSTQVS